jgi:hypothetical protein
MMIGWFGVIVDADANPAKIVKREGWQQQQVPAD